MSERSQFPRSFSRNFQDDLLSFHQSAVLLPPAARAQTWKWTIANTNLLVAKIAAAAVVGRALLVFSIQPPELNSGSQSVRVSGGDSFYKYHSESIRCHRGCHLTKLSWQLSKQHSKNRDATSRGWTGPVVTIHCIPH